MTDHFATLHLSRRPWLDADVVKDAFQKIGAARHPDSPGGTADAFAALNAAWQVLREPCTRVRHLLELEAPAALAVAQTIPPGLADLFMQIGTHRQSFDAFLKAEAKASSPLAKALLEPDKIATRENVARLSALVADRSALALDELRAIDAAWKNERPFARLAELSHALSFLGKWSDQLDEDALKLNLPSPREPS